VRYRLDHTAGERVLEVEDSFTLLDFMALFVCLLAGFWFALFLWMFAVALLIKLFTRHEFRFSSDTYFLTHHLKIFSYFRVKRRSFSFEEIEALVLTNTGTGQALAGRGLVRRDWFSIDILKKDRQRVQIVKGEPDELPELDALFHDLQDALGHWFVFSVDYQVPDAEDPIP
jgi:hypothetical protein